MFVSKGSFCCRLDGNDPFLVSKKIHKAVRMFRFLMDLLEEFLMVQTFKNPEVFFHPGGPILSFQSRYFRGDVCQSCCGHGWVQ